MLGTVGWTSGRVLKENWICVEEVRVAEGDGKPVIAVSDIAQSFSQTLACGVKLKN